MSHKKAVRAVVLNGDKLLAMKRNKFGLEYYTLIGGGVDVGEGTETVLRRELQEETGMVVGAMRLVFIEDAGELYGEQYVYYCEYQGGDPVLDAESEEAKISALGHNTYQPLWLPVKDIPNVTFRSTSVRDAVLNALQNGFPDNPQTLAWKG